ncbi:MAG TPA: hypothetical protein VFC75_03370 [Erysipelothrix sp.]|nr:hypothetical protein [Erysipelothrix sp.]
MRKRIPIILSLVIIMLFNLVVNSPTSYAETANTDLTIETQLTGPKPEVDPVFEIVIESDDENFPMPIGAIDGVYEVALKGAQKVLFPVIEYTGIGDYSYTIYQKEFDDESYEIDKTIYKLFVIVTLDEETGGFVVTFNLYKLGEEEKSDNILFINKYTSDVLGEKIEPPKPVDKPKGVLGKKILPLTGSVDVYYMLGLGSIMIGILIKTLIKTREETES